MNSKLTFTVKFHTPFAVDNARDIPATSIKGMMLDTARDLALPWPVIRQVFGGTERDRFAEPRPAEGTEDPPLGATIQSPWAWSNIAWPAGPDLVASSTRSRIRIDDTTGSAAQGALFPSNEYRAVQGSFEIEQIGAIPVFGLFGEKPPDETSHRTLLQVDSHRAVLQVAARCTSALGGTRRRGMGWVTINFVPSGDPSAVDLDDAELASRMDEIKTKESGP